MFPFGGGSQAPRGNSPLPLAGRGETASSAGGGGDAAPAPSPHPTHPGRPRARSDAAPGRASREAPRAPGCPGGRWEPPAEAAAAQAHRSGPRYVGASRRCAEGVGRTRGITRGLSRWNLQLLAEKTDGTQDEMGLVSLDIKRSRLRIWVHSVRWVPECGGLQHHREA
ncbi:hypothetical protein VULLAG_LOCUS12509 [Vulpes lagopus]